MACHGLRLGTATSFSLSLSRYWAPGSHCARNDFGNDGYDGSAPPEGDREHRYIFAIHALDTDDTGVPEGASPTYASFVHVGHTIARATITGTWSC